MLRTAPRLSFVSNLRSSNSLVHFRPRRFANTQPSPPIETITTATETTTKIHYLPPEPKKTYEDYTKFAWNAPPQPGLWGRLRSFFRKYFLMDPDAVPWTPAEGFRTPSPAISSQKPRVFSPEMADKSENIASISYFNRGRVHRPIASGKLLLDLESSKIISPLAEEEAAKKAAEQAEIKKLEAEGKKVPPHFSPVTTTPVVEAQRLDVDLSSLKDWRKDMSAEFLPPEQRHFLRKTNSYFYRI